MDTPTTSLLNTTSPPSDLPNAVLDRERRPEGSNDNVAQAAGQLGRAGQTPTSENNKARKATKKEPKPKVARLSHYTEEIAAEICARLSEGESLLGICKAKRMPAERTVREWAIDDREGFAVRYSRARDLGLDHHAEKIIELADVRQMGVKKETGVGPQGEFEKTVTGDMVERARLQIDARKWYLSKLAPKRYGDKLAVEHGADGGVGAALAGLLERVMK